MEGYPDGWSEGLKGGVKVLTRTFEFGNFAQAMAFAVSCETIWKQRQIDVIVTATPS